MASALKCIIGIKKGLLKLYVVSLKRLGCYTLEILKFALVNLSIWIDWVCHQLLEFTILFMQEWSKLPSTQKSVHKTQRILTYGHEVTLHISNRKVRVFEQCAKKHSMYKNSFHTAQGYEYSNNMYLCGQSQE